jgi:hypothetical protein
MLMSPRILVSFLLILESFLRILEVASVLVVVAVLDQTVLELVLDQVAALVAVPWDLLFLPISSLETWTWEVLELQGLSGRLVFLATWVLCHL